MKTYEYIRVMIDVGDLEDLNSLASTGWHVVGMFQSPYTYIDKESKVILNAMTHFALLERELPDKT